MPTAIQPRLRIDAELDALVDHYLSAGGASPRTQNSHRRHWPRWVRFCETVGVAALAGDEDTVIGYVDSFDGVKRATIDIYLAAIAWHYQQAGLDDPTAGPLVDKSLDEKIRAEAMRPGVRRTTKSKTLPAQLMREVLVLPPPPPSRRAVFVQARLVLSWHLDLALLDRLARVDPGSVVAEAGALHVGGRTLPATGDRTCPVGAWVALQDHGFEHGLDGVFGGVDACEDGWVHRAGPDVDKGHLGLVRSAYAAVTGIPVVELPCLSG